MSCKAFASSRSPSTPSCRRRRRCCPTGAPRSSRSSTSNAGDAMRGLVSTGVVADMGNDVHPLLEHSNRGKKSLGLDLTSPDGLAILHQLIATSDVFLTNKLPRVLKKLHIEVDEVRAHNEQIIYVRGHGQGARGPDADKGSYDSLAFWARAGVAIGATRPEYDLVVEPARAGVRRLHRRDDHRRRDHGRAVPPGTHGRGHDRRRVAARHRPLGDGPGGRALAADEHPVDGTARRPDALQPAGRDVRDQRRSSDLVVLPAGGPVLAAAVRSDRSTGARHRSALRRPRVAARAHRRGPGHPARGVRGAHRRRVARARWPTSSGSGPSSSTRSRRPPTRSRWRTATSRTSPPRRARRSS